MPPSLYLYLEKIRFILNSIPIKKPFLSILYVYQGSTLYYLILHYNSLKYNKYLKAKSALFLFISMPDIYRDIRLTSYLLINRSAHNLPTSLPPILEAKLCIICLKGGNPRL